MRYLLFRPLCSPAPGGFRKQRLTGHVNGPWRETDLRKRMLRNDDATGGSNSPFRASRRTPQEEYIPKTLWPAGLRRQARALEIEHVEGASRPLDGRLDPI